MYGAQEVRKKAKECKVGGGGRGGGAGGAGGKWGGGKYSVWAK